MMTKISEDLEVIFDLRKTINENYPGGKPEEVLAGNITLRILDGVKKPYVDAELEIEGGKKLLKVLLVNIRPGCLISNNQEIFDENGVPWKNRANEYKRKYEKLKAKMTKED